MKKLLLVIVCSMLTLPASAASWKASEYHRLHLAEAFDTELLNSGIEAKVEAVGLERTTLKITYIGCGRVFMHKLSNDGKGRLNEKFNNFAYAGFTLFRCYDGYKQNWYIKLRPNK